MPALEVPKRSSFAASAPIAEKLVAWYDEHHRDLPWRIAPRARRSGARPDPYRVWLSEIMLQQTTVEAVKPYFRAFVARWPDVEALAAAPTDDVMAAWAGLGYYSRARNLKKCAEAVAEEHGGRFPETEEELLALPGIGPYTAAAIAAIAFDRPAVVIDGNIERVFARLSNIETPLPAAKPAIRAAVAAASPAHRPGDFAQAAMDLGATICTPRMPTCLVCPVSEDCLALRHGDPARLPFKAPKAARPVRRGAAFVALCDDAVLLRRRPPEGLLGGMTEVPGTAWSARADGDTGTAAAPFAADWRDCGQIRHVFTHFELRLEVFCARLGVRPELAGGWWAARASLDAAGLPTIMKKAVEAALHTMEKHR